MLGIQNEREWRAFCDIVLERPSLANDPRFASNALRNDNRAALQDLLLAAFSTLESGELRERLDKAQIANARVNDMHDVWRHPQLHARERWATVGTPAGAIPALLPPGANDSFAPRMHAVPALGEHTESILRELGMGIDAP